MQTGRPAGFDVIKAADRRRFAGQLPPCPLRGDDMVTLLRKLYSRSANKLGTMIEVVATQQGEGVSAVVQGLARAADSLGLKAIICDLSPTHDTLKRMELPPDFISVSTALQSGLDLYEAVYWLNGTPNINVAACALTDKASQGVWLSIDADCCDVIGSWLRASFDVVLLDSPPLQANPVGQAMCKVSDGVVMVVEAERTKVRPIAATRKAIEANGGRVAGVVLNKRRMHVPRRVYQWL